MWPKGLSFLADWDARLTTGFAELAAAAGLRVPPLPHANRSEHLHYSAYFSAEGRDRVAEAFAEDVAAFGYGFEIHAA